MKVLHALVGYLAVTALPFHPFAFASHDGYVNTTQNHIDGALMKQVLGGIIETCQTITIQNHEDNALMKRVHGDIIEARQGEIIVPIAFIVTVIVTGIILKLLWYDENPVGGYFVEFPVEHSDH